MLVVVSFFEWGMGWGRCLFSINYSQDETKSIRFALFEKEEEDKSKAESKFKDDSRQLRYVFGLKYLVS